MEVAAVDLTDRTASESFLRDLDARAYTPDVLINNAGQGLSGPLARLLQKDGHVTGIGRYPFERDTKNRPWPVP